jgi:hypothetical protein
MTAPAARTPPTAAHVPALRRDVLLFFITLPLTILSFMALLLLFYFGNKNVSYLLHLLHNQTTVGPAITLSHFGGIWGCVLRKALRRKDWVFSCSPQSHRTTITGCIGATTSSSHIHPTRWRARLRGTIPTCVGTATKRYAPAQIDPLCL